MFYYQKKGIPSENPFLFRKELLVIMLAWFLWRQRDMTYVKDVWQIKIVLEFLTSEFSHARELNLASTKKLN